MKKLMYSIALLGFIFSGVKATTNIDKVTDPKESIKYAIKKSRPDLLKKALINFEATENDKNWLLIYANEVAQIRKNKMNINLIKPKEVNYPGETYLLYSLGITGISLLAIASFLKSFDKDPQSASILIFGTTVANILIVKKLYQIAKEKNTEFLKTYRTPKQKYLAAVDIVIMIQSK